MTRATFENDEVTVLPAPLNQPFYSCERLAEIFDLSPNYIRRLFAKEPDTLNLGDRRVILRIPHSAVVRVLKRREIGAKKSILEKLNERRKA